MDVTCVDDDANSVDWLNIPLATVESLHIPTTFVPCNVQWSNLHMLVDDDSCVRFTAASSGPINDFSAVIEYVSNNCFTRCFVELNSATLLLGEGWSLFPSILDAAEVESTMLVNGGGPCWLAILFVWGPEVWSMTRAAEVDVPPLPPFALDDIIVTWSWPDIILYSKFVWVIMFPPFGNGWVAYLMKFTHFTILNVKIYIIAFRNSIRCCTW